MNSKRVRWLTKPHVRWGLFLVVASGLAGMSQPAHAKRTAPYTASVSSAKKGRQAQAPGKSRDASVGRSAEKFCQDWLEAGWEKVKACIRAIFSPVRWCFESVCAILPEPWANGLRWVVRKTGEHVKLILFMGLVLLFGWAWCRRRAAARQAEENAQRETAESLRRLTDTELITWAEQKRREATPLPEGLAASLYFELDKRLLPHECPGYYASEDAGDRSADTVKKFQALRARLVGKEKSPCPENKLAAAEEKLKKELKQPSQPLQQGLECNKLAEFRQVVAARGAYHNTLIASLARLGGQIESDDLQLEQYGLDTLDANGKQRCLTWIEKRMTLFSGLAEALEEAGEFMAAQIAQLTRVGPGDHQGWLAAAGNVQEAIAVKKQAVENHYWRDLYHGILNKFSFLLKEEVRVRQEKLAKLNRFIKQQVEKWNRESASQRSGKNPDATEVSKRYGEKVRALRTRCQQWCRLYGEISKGRYASLDGIETAEALRVIAKERKELQALLATMEEAGRFIHMRRKTPSVHGGDIRRPRHQSGGLWASI